MVELAQRVPARSPPLKSTSTPSPFAMLRTLSVRAFTSSREYMAREYIAGADLAGKSAGGVMATTDIQRLTSGVPKVIDPKTHAVLDYLVAGTFLTAGWWMRRRNTRASGLAFANGIAVLGATLFCDYPGGVWPLFSFKTHGLLDMMQAGMAGAGPSVLGFASEPEAQFFHGQALSEVGVVAATDFAAA